MRYLFTVTGLTPSQTTQGAVDIIAEEAFPRGVDPTVQANVGPTTGTLSLHITAADAAKIVLGGKLTVDLSVGLPAAK